MPSIVLATLNARYHHCAFGLRYLLANMGGLRDETALLEFTINQQTLEILDAILQQQPRIVGLGVYIWNVDETTRLVADLKRVAPDVIVVLGGPEVSYETEEQPIARLADHVITGEADLAFAALCRDLLQTPIAESGLSEMGGRGSRRAAINDGHEITARRDPRPPIGLTDAGTSHKIIHAPVPDLNQLALPYDLYSDTDLAQRVLYVEASRGCPFTCEFCLSALEIPVRQFALEPFLAEMDRLLGRGARQFKFVDRTFNLNIRVSRAILEFFLERYQPGMFLHFELIPDRLPEALQEIIARFPPGALQFEVGIQTFNDEVSELISRRQDNALVDQNLTWLRDHTPVHVHADLIVGLPGESLESFASGFDRLIRLAPHEIQVGILKRLRGTPIIRHDEAWQMVYSPHPPYEILRTSLMDFATIQELRRFAKLWDTIGNSGNFVETTALLWEGVRRQESGDRSDNALGVSPLDSSFGAGRRQPPGTAVDGEPSPFAEFQRLSRWLFAREGQSHGIALSRMVELLFEYLTHERDFASADVAAVLWRDYQRGGRSDKPACLRPFINDHESVPTAPADRAGSGPMRQHRHRQSPILP
jgi:radical SAM superfamily enzyme YgiQ (UPF0313 family)